MQVYLKIIVEILVMEIKHGATPQILLQDGNIVMYMVIIKYFHYIDKRRRKEVRR